MLAQGNLPFTFGMRFGPDGNLYVADTSAAGVIHVINRDGTKVGEIGADEDSIYRVDRYYGIDIDRQDRLYVLAGSSYSDYWVRIYRDLELYKSFGAGDASDTLVYFDEATSLSVVSGARNSVYVTDVDQNKTFRFDLLEYPDPAFGLSIAANRKTIELMWNSSQSPMIEKYDIEAASTETGPFKRISASSELRQT